MKRKFTTKFILIVALLMVISANVKSQAFTENFDDTSTLTANGWFMQNNSDPIGVEGWEKGEPTVFSAYNGNNDSYISASNENIGGLGTISNWLIAPTRTLRNGDVFSFYTRTTNDFPDRLQVWLSTNGESTTVGTGATETGDFTTLLLDINPTLVLNVYPVTWTKFSITISGLSAPTSGRIAFRYFVTNANSVDGDNSDYIGIDEVDYEPNLINTNVTNLPEIQHVNIFPNPTAGEFTVNYDQTIIGNLTVKIINLQGKVIITDERTDFSGLFSKKYDLRSFEDGLYLLQLINNDSQAIYKIIIQK